MTNEQLWNAFDALPDRQILESLPPSWRPDAPAAPTPRRASRVLSFFLDNGWVAAVLSAVVAVSLIVAIVLAGRGSPDIPVGTESPESESVIETTEPTETGDETSTGLLPPTLDSTNPYAHPLNSRARMTVTADGVTTDLTRAYIHKGRFNRSKNDKSGAPDGEWAFEFPPIDGYYLSFLAADPTLTTITVSSPTELSWKADWPGADSILYGLAGTYDEEFRRVTTRTDELPDGVYYFVFKTEIEGGTHSIGDAVYVCETFGHHAHYQIPCRVVIGDADFSPPTEAPTPPANLNDPQTEFKSSCFASNGDGTCSFTLRGYQMSKTLQIPAISPKGDRVTEIKSCRPPEMGSVVILPDTVEVIADGAFARCAGLETVVLGAGVREIGKEAFYRSRGLRSVNLEDTALESIGESAFGECYRLSSVHMPSSVRTVGECAYIQCLSLSEVTLSENLEELPNRMFRECRALTRIDIPAGVTSIGYEAFNECQALARVTMGEGVTEIGRAAFERCIALTEITLPESLTLMDERVFYACTSLTAINLPAGLDSLSRFAFAQSGLCAVTVPEGITEIPEAAFEGCTRLANVHLPTTVESIGYEAFRGTALSEITLPASVKTIKRSAFAGCNSLSTVRMEGAITIEQQAFYYCESLRSVTLNEGLLTLGDRAFAECTALTDINLPASITDMGDAVFENSGVGGR